MKVFVTGASGYIGGSVAQRLHELGHEVSGLVRSEEKARSVKDRGIEPVIGTLDDAQVLDTAARGVDAVVDAASADHRPSVETLLAALERSGKTLIRTSGSSIVGDDARGDSENPAVYTEDTYFEPIPYRRERVAVDRLVRAAGIDRGIRAIVICPSMIYGKGLGLQPDSDQIPRLTKLATSKGAGVYIGAGANRWSNVSIGDLVDLYVLALEKAPAASFFFAENGEASLREIAESISRSLGLGGKTQSLGVEEAIQEYGDRARYGLASNSRVRAVNARRTLGWSPHGPSLAGAVEGRPWTRSGSPRNIQERWP